MGRPFKPAGIVDLAAYRESRGISLQEIARTTRITVRYLQAIERAEFKKLPGGVYDVSYIRQYAGEIGLDASALLDFYYSQMPREEPPEERPAKHGFLGLSWSLRRTA
jgi:cytoskeleton protein RodZ